MSTLKALALLLIVALSGSSDVRNSSPGRVLPSSSLEPSVALAPQVPQGGDKYCHECYGECLYDFGGSCSPGRAGKYGLSKCSTDILAIDFGLVMCSCDWQDGVICQASASLETNERETLIKDARTVVAMGGVLPADGLFYSARNSGKTVVRWKCDGALAARISV